MSEQWRALAVHVPLARMVVGAMMAFTLVSMVLLIISEHLKYKDNLSEMWDRSQKKLAKANMQSNCKTILALGSVLLAILGAVEYVLYQK